MKKIIVLFALLAMLMGFVSCEKKEQEKMAKTEMSEDSMKEDSMSGDSMMAEDSETREESLTDAEGNKLDLFFNFKEETVKISFNGEEALLKQEVTASGYRYSNDEYELDGKGESVWLRKGETVIFKYEVEK